MQIIKSPLNYTGGNYKLLPQLLPLFPKNISTFVDLFCGGCNVAVNVEAEKFFCNDLDSNLVDLLKYFQSLNTEEIIQRTFNNIFSLLPDEFYDLGFEPCDKLTESILLEEISPLLKYDENKLLKVINKDNKTNFTDISEVKKFVSEERNTRFNKLIDDKFVDNTLIHILELFKERKGPQDDAEIQSLVTDEADGPTIFEYILAIVWYKISERKGDVLSFMNLSLEADLLPKTHAGGGEADIVWKYEKSSDYPQHDLLIEATLSDSTNQRRMEMEPVSRHLGDYILTHKNYETYCIFLTNYLHINVIADFRARKNAIYYSSNGEDCTNGMMITPFETDLLIQILKNKLKYKELYQKLHNHHNNDLLPKEWYATLVKEIG